MSIIQFLRLVISFVDAALPLFTYESDDFLKLDCYTAAQCHCFLWSLEVSELYYDI